MKPPLATWISDEDDVDWGNEPAVGQIDSQAKSLSRMVCTLWAEQVQRAEDELRVNTQEEPSIPVLLAHFHALLHLAVVQKDYRKVDALNLMIVELLEAYTERT